MGFEPTVRYYPYTGLANQRLQPLGHLSAPLRGGLVAENLCAQAPQSWHSASGVPVRGYANKAKTSFCKA
jgi:hypothetical protein